MASHPIDDMPEPPEAQESSDASPPAPVPAAPMEPAGELAVALTVFCVTCGKELVRPAFDVRDPWSAQAAGRPCRCGVIHVTAFYRRK